MILKHAGFLFIILLAVSVLIGCDDVVQPDQQIRLILYESIDGVRIGDNTTTVIQKLGMPTRIVALDDNIGVRFEYEKGKHATMKIAIYKETVRPSGVMGVSVSAPYQGTTKEGIGIGSSKETVLQQLGPPSSYSQFTDSTAFDDYNNVKNMFLFFYKNNVIESISFSWKTWPSSDGSEQ